MSNSFICSSIHSFWSEYVPGAFVDTDMYPSWQGIVCIIPTSHFPSAPWLHPRVVGAYSVTQGDTVQSEPAVEKDAFPDLCVLG